jgi:hypothetical protein
MLSALAVFFAVLFAAIRFPDSVQTLPVALVVAAAVSPILLFPALIAVFPSLFATRWVISRETIHFSVPSRLGPAGFEKQNAGFVAIEHGRWFTRARRAGKGSLMLPRVLVGKTGPGRETLEFVLAEDRLELRARQ